MLGLKVQEGAMDLKSALAISTFLHLLLFAPYFHNVKFPLSPEDKRYSLELDYVRTRDYLARVPPAPARPVEKEMVSVESDKVVPAPQPAKTAILSEEETPSHKKDYVSYYQIVRDQIRRKLNENYTGESEEGDIYLDFTIDEGGDLVGFEIDRARSTPSPALERIAEISLKESSPFPPPPEGIKKSRIPFNVTVSFKKK